MMKAIITGGGSGGHIYPAMAIAEKIKEKEPGTEFLYIGNDLGLEKDIVPALGYPIELVAARWFDKSSVIELVHTGLTTLRGTVQAYGIMRKFRPDVVIGTGGFVCVPVMYAGRLYGARCYIHEQNAFPGLANRALEKIADKVFLGFPEAGAYFKEPKKHVITGNPVRKKFYDINRETARRKLGLPGDDFVVFSFGGSQGAEKINEVGFGLMEALNGHEGMTYIYATGAMHYDSILAMAKARGTEIRGNIRIRSYIDDMEYYLAASDLIISRAGALSVAETMVCGKASILVPSPHVPGNHQYYNARSVADRGGALLIEEKDLSAESLISQVMRLKNNPGILKRISEAARSCAPSGAAELIYSEIKKDERELLRRH